MRTGRMVVGIAAGLALLSACGSSKSSSDTSAAAAATAAAATTAAPATTAAATTEAPETTAATVTTAAASGAAPIVVATSPLGQILTNAKGMTLYAYTKDTAGTSTCAGACAESWPAATTTSATLPAGLDPKVFSVVEGPNETYQLKAGQWPLYTFIGDSAPGQTNGQGTLGVWYVVAPDGSLIKA